MYYREMSPLWKRGIKGDFKNKSLLFMIHKISPDPSLPKRGILVGKTNLRK